VFDNRDVPYYGGHAPRLRLLLSDELIEIDRANDRAILPCSGEHMKIAIAMVALLTAWPFASAKDYPMTAATGVPGATGVVKVQRAKDNGNMKLDIKVDHLARPSSLTPSANNYLVWIRPNGGEAFKQGAIGVDKNLSGELRLETVSKDFDVFITAEQSDTVTFPSSVEVLGAHVSAK
jgi:hypothetical protein